MYKYCYLNDRFVTDKQAKVSVADIGFLRGFGVFDLTQCYCGVPFHLNDHLRRLGRSARLAGLRIPFSDRRITELSLELLKKNQIKDENCCLRILITGGPAKNGLEFDNNEQTFLIRAEPVPIPDRKFYDRGARVITCNHQRPLAKAKSTNYLQAVALQPLKKKRKAAEVFYHNNGYILEASTSNIFFIKQGKLITPQDDVLPGVTKQIVVKLAQRAGWSIEERAVKLSELSDFEEVFLTASNKEVLPVVEIDDLVINKGQIGPYSREMAQRFSRYVDDYIKRRKKNDGS